VPQGGMRRRVSREQSSLRLLRAVSLGTFVILSIPAARAESQVPAGMIPYDHPVFKNGHIVLWHGPSHGGGAPAAKGAVDAASTRDGIVIIADGSDPAERRLASDVAAALGGAHIKAEITQGPVNAAGLSKAIDEGESDFAVVALAPLLARDDTVALRAKAPIIARLGAETIDVIAGKSVASIAALDGAKVDVGPENSPQAVTLALLFDRLGLHPQLQHHPLEAALQMLQTGKLDAVAAMGVPTPSSLSDFGVNGDFHEIAVAWSPALRGLFTPATRADRERPHLIAAGSNSFTVGAPVALVGLGDAGASEGAAKAVTALYEGIASQKAPWDGAPWTSVNFACRAPNWPRAKALDDWVSAHGSPPETAMAAFQNDAGAAAGDPDRLYASLLRLRAGQP
jgi:hypothetical protein